MSLPAKGELNKKTAKKRSSVKGAQKVVLEHALITAGMFLDYEKLERGNRA